MTSTGLNSNILHFENMTQAKSLLYMKLSFQQYVFGKVENYLETNDIFTVNLDYGPNRKFIQHELMQFFFFFFFLNWD